MSLPNLSKLKALSDLAEGLPPKAQAAHLAELAIMIAKQGDRGAAATLALKSMRLARELDDPAAIEAARRAFGKTTAGYHVQISTDPTRIAAWREALWAAIKPGMLALEVGVGSGILSLLAAEAGAQVVACENDPVIAAVAEEIVAANGYSDRIRVISEPVEALTIPRSLPRPADVLLLDVFADDLFSFRPFAILRAAAPLLAPGAAIVPVRASLMAALADFGRWDRMIPHQVAGFDMGPLRDIAVVRQSLDAATPDLELRSEPQMLLDAALPGALLPSDGQIDAAFASTGGRVNGVAVWLRLELAPGIVLEARPGTRPLGYYAQPNFHAFRNPRETKAGESCGIQLIWKGSNLRVIPA